MEFIGNLGTLETGRAGTGPALEGCSMQTRHADGWVSRQPMLGSFAIIQPKQTSSYPCKSPLISTTTSTDTALQAKEFFTAAIGMTNLSAEG